MTGAVILVVALTLLAAIFLCLSWAMAHEFKRNKEQDERLEWTDYQRVVDTKLYDASRAEYNGYVFEIRKEARPSQNLWISEVYSGHEGNLYRVASNYAFSKREAKEMAICSADAIDFQEAKRTNQGEQDGRNA